MDVKRYPDWEELFALALQAGVIMKKNFFESHMEKTSWKNDNTPVTATDMAVNDLILNMMRRDYPHINVMGEEKSSRLSEDKEFAIIADPLDGTIPFTLKQGGWTFCICLLQHGRPIVALIHDPLLGFTWIAEKGEGAFLHHRKFFKALQLGLLASHPIVSLMWWHGSVGNLDAVRPQVNDHGFQWMNTCAVAMSAGKIAEGRLAGSVFGGQSCWESPAMELIVTEAGGKATDLFGNPLEYLKDEPNKPVEILPIKGHIMAHPKIHGELVDMVARANPRADP